MITGYSIVQDLRASAASESKQTQAAIVEGTGPCNAAVINVGLALSDPLRSTVEHHKVKRTHTGAFFPGDNVWAVLYRKVKLRPSIIQSTLSLSGKGWTVMLKQRGQTEHSILIEPELEAPTSDIKEECGVMEALKDDGIEWELVDEEGDDIFLLQNMDIDSDGNQENDME